VDYTLTNPGPGTPTAGDLGASFEKAIHRYNALEVTADKRFRNRWALQASYRYSRLRGTFEGFFRDDNGQSDPGITSLFDFRPTTRATRPSACRSSAIAATCGSRRARCGAAAPGSRAPDQGLRQLPVSDRINVGTGISISSGKPLTALAAHPVYGNAGEIPEGPRGSGFETIDGFQTRTPFTYNAAVHADYGLKIGKAQRIVVLADVFNLFNGQRALDYDPDTQTSFPVLNPDFGQPSRANLAQLQTPRQVRFGVRFEF